ncbi:hypothetical protein NPIL_559791 [Nephila pilipes]|uniref:Pre-C2HC domain-containing protein n=1 Tax=Nephila pilipes TaxID=299642 RepID=A0A8X6MI46_NEPPI|nr:hypothetical protein NPIL_559791 [Nephila pilipes]
MESATTSEELLHIANCVEANLSDSLTNPQQNDELKETAKELSEKNITVDEIHVLTNKRNGYPMPLFLATPAKKADNQKIYNVTQLGCVEVKVEALRKKHGPTQCFCCQGIFHSYQFCTRKPRCVKCTRNPLTKE